MNMERTENLDLSIALPQSMNTATTLQAMTQLSSGAAAPSLAATSGVTIQGAAIAVDGAFTPSEAYRLTVDGRRLSCYAPALSAVLIQLS